MHTPGTGTSQGGNDYSCCFGGQAGRAVSFAIRSTDTIVRCQRVRQYRGSGLLMHVHLKTSWLSNASTPTALLTKTLASWLAA